MPEQTFGLKSAYKPPIDANRTPEFTVINTVLIITNRCSTFPNMETVYIFDGMEKFTTPLRIGAQLRRIRNLEFELFELIKKRNDSNEPEKFMSERIDQLQREYSQFLLET